MARQNKLKRISIFLSRYYKAKKMLFLQSKKEGMKSGPKVLLNSIPKAGTNLLDGYLQALPPLRPSGHRTLSGWNEISQKTINKIIEIKKGEYYTAHLPAHKNLLNALRGSDIRVLLIVRDPRAVLVSNFKYVLDIDVTHPTHKYIKSLKNDRERLIACIKGKKNILTPINEIYELFLDWQNQDNCLVVKFEDLVGQRGGGDAEIQIQTISKIINHLNITMDKEEILNIIMTMEKTSSPTLRSGQIDGWKKYFDTELSNILESQLGRSAEKFGYFL
jgi:hypothetical protein